MKTFKCPKYKELIGIWLLNKFARTWLFPFNFQNKLVLRVDFYMKVFVN